MAIANFIAPPTPLSVELDRDADVLYLSSGWQGPVEGAGLADGIELDFCLDTDTPCGVTVIGFRVYGWDARLHELADLVGGHLGRSREHVLMELTAALAR